MKHAVHRPYLLALDQGTTSSRALIFDAQGAVVASAQQELTQHFPQPGWVEHAPEEIWQSQLACARAALEKAKLPAQAISAIGIANQRETTLLWDRASGQPLGHAIVWQDRRTASACEALRVAGHSERINAITGLVPDPYFSASKLAWMLDNIPQARVRAEAGELAFGTVDSWLIWRLTGGTQHLTDVSNASRTLLYDIRASDWSEEMLALFNIPAALLPRVLPSSADFGHTEASLLGASLPILGVAGDQQAALFAQGCHAAGEAKNTYGTGCFALMHSGGEAIRSQHGLLSTRAAQVGNTPQYALEGSVFMAGALVQWLRDGLGLIDKAADIEALARQVPDSGGVHIIPAHAGLGAPYWRADARGAIVGLSRGSHKAHIAHAALAAIACQTTELLQAMQADSGIRVPFLRVDGGASANDLLMQMQADLLGMAVQRPAMREATAWGAALLAGLRAKVWPDAASALGSHPPSQLFQPSLNAAQRAERMAQWRQAVQSVL